MSTEDSKKFFNRYMEALMADKSPQTVARFVSDEGLIEHIAMFEAGFPGYQLEVDDLIVEGEKIVLRGTFSGVHRGEFQSIPPTGREVRLPLVVIYRVENDKVAEHWIIADLHDLMQQLTAAPAAAR